MDMDTFNDDFKVSGKDKHKPYEVEHEPLSQADVEKLMLTDVEHISGIFGVDVSVSALLPGASPLKWSTPRQAQPRFYYAS
jgi:ariadne-1